ncbi:MAG: hypothetical protein EOO07_20465, partial [Chitinophagaceae bacterium]
MLPPQPEMVITILILCSLAFVFLLGMVIYFLYETQKKQILHFKNLEELKIHQQNELLQAQLEMQEQTFANISGEIHDNIGQKLTLAKLHLNTLPANSDGKVDQVNQSIRLIGEVIADLSDMSRSMSSEIVLQSGLIKAVEFEVGQIVKTGLFEIKSRISGEPFFLPSDNELVLFRIVQEALHNIIKHARATRIFIELNYSNGGLKMVIKDDGLGFIPDTTDARGIGLANMQRRAT